MNRHRSVIVLLAISLFALSSCASHDGKARSNNKTSIDTNVAIKALVCAGEVAAPAVFATRLTQVERPDLVTASLGIEGVGGLCQAKAYEVTQPFEVFRAWNSQNPKSELGHWWSFSMPSGKIADYREKYAICPKYSPLDMMVRCTLKEGSIVVLGTGQSASCNAFQYPASSAIQLYLSNAGDNTEACQSFNGVFSWQNINKKPKSRSAKETPTAADDSY